MAGNTSPLGTLRGTPGQHGSIYVTGLGMVRYVFGADGTVCRYAVDRG